MNKRNTCLVAIGSVVGVVAYRYAARAWSQARATAQPYEKPTVASWSQFIGMVRGLWRHPEALAMMRNNPDIAAPLTDAVLASFVQVRGDGEPALADRALARLSLLGETIRGRRASTPSAVSPAHEALAAAFARETLVGRGDPAADRFDELIAAFGTRTAHDLVTYVRLVSALVLVVNTWEALVSRMLGKPAADSRLSDELKVLAVFSMGILPLIPVGFVRTLLNPAG
jgi:hypothetical protein